MVIIRKIRKVGNSLMIPLPPQTISESGFNVGMELAIRSRPGHVDLDPTGVPDKWLEEFAARFTERYREELAELADLSTPDAFRSGEPLIGVVAREVGVDPRYVGTELSLSAADKFGSNGMVDESCGHSSVGELQMGAGESDLAVR